MRKMTNEQLAAILQLRQFGHTRSVAENQLTIYYERYEDQRRRYDEICQQLEASIGRCREAGLTPEQISILLDQQLSPVKEFQKEDVDIDE